MFCFVSLHLQQFLLGCSNIINLFLYRQSMPVARAFREAQASACSAEDSEMNEKASGLVQNVSTRWNSSLAMFR